MKNCYIVAARPDSPDKFKLLLENLRLLRENTKCPIILSLNYYPYGIENWKEELYDYIVYSDINEVVFHNDQDSAPYKYVFTTDWWIWRSDESRAEFGRAVNNLYLRGVQLGKSLGMDNYIIMNYDVAIKNKKTTSIFENSSKNVFIEDMSNTTTGENFYNTWFMKLNNSLIPMLEHISTEEGYNEIKYDQTYPQIGFYETIIRRYLESKHMPFSFNDGVEIIQMRDFEKLGIDMDCDNLFKEFRCVIDPDTNEVIMLVEFMMSSVDRIVSLEINNEVHTLGNCSRMWRTIGMGEWYEDMKYKVTINGKTYHRHITKELLNKNTITKIN